jgi:FxsC-like protein
MPVLWDRPNKLPSNSPKIVSEIQYTHDEFGQEYADLGLDLLMRQPKTYADAYEQFIVRFADKLVQVGLLNPPLPPLQQIQALSVVESAFHTVVPPLQQGCLDPEPESESENVGPDFVHLVFIAGRKDELNGIKHGLEAYGDRGGRYWRPYIPAFDKMVGLITQGVAASENLQHEVLPVRGDLLEKLRKLEETNTIVVIVVDPWSIKVKSYRDYMEDYDKGNFANCGVLILWNQGDGDLTEDNREKLRDVIEKTFSRDVVFGNPCFRDSVVSADDMTKELKAIIEKVRGRIMQRAKLLRPMEIGSNSSIPRVSGPGGR